MADCWVKSPDCNFNKNVILVISIDDENGNILWNAVSVYNQLIDKNNWNNINILTDYKNNTPGRTLKAYLWNTSNEDFILDDFRVMVRGL